MKTPDTEPSAPTGNEAQPDFLARTFAGWRSQRGLAQGASAENEQGVCCAT